MEGNEKKTMTKDELKALIQGELAEQLKTRSVEPDENLKAMMKELVDESVKGMTAPRKVTPFEEGKEDPKGGFANFAEFAKAVYDAGENMSGINTIQSKEVQKLKTWVEKSDNIQKTAGSPTQSTGSLATGGALVPPEFSSTALSRAAERSDMLAKATKIPMSTNTINVPCVKDFDNSQGAVAGNVKFRWVAEMDEAEGSNVEFGEITLTLKEANALIYVSKNLMKFSPVSLQPLLTSEVDKALDLALSNAFVNGTGAGTPLGILEAACLVSVAKETGQKADTLVYENILNMSSRFYGNGGDWYASRTVIPQLGVMSVSVGAGGSAVWVPVTQGGSLPTGVLGSPLNFNQVMPILGDAGDMTLCDWSQYLIGSYSQGMEMEESAHLKFDYRQHAFQFSFFIDGQPWWTSAFSPKKGVSMSPFVTTAARA